MLLFALLMAASSTSARGQAASTHQEKEVQLMDLMKIGPEMKSEPAMLIAPPKPARKKPSYRPPQRLNPKSKAKPVVEPSQSSTLPVVILDDTHKAVSSRLVGLANQLDSFFGEKRADDELNRSSIRISYAYRVRMENKPWDDTQFRFNLRLPNLEEKFRFSMDKDDKEKKETAQDDDNPNVAPKKVEPEVVDPWRFRFDTGINVSYPPIIFTRARLRKNWTFPWFIQRFTEEFAWISDRGFLQTTTLFSDKDINERMLFRFVNEQNWLINDKEFTTAHGPSILHTISDDDALSYNVRMQSKIDDQWFVHNYNVSIAYRRNLRDQWLYGEITPGIDFPKTESFRRSPFILFRIETLFGNR